MRLRSRGTGLAHFDFAPLISDVRLGAITLFALRRVHARLLCAPPLSCPPSSASPVLHAPFFPDFLRSFLASFRSTRDEHLALSAPRCLPAPSNASPLLCPLRCSRRATAPSARPSLSARRPLLRPSRILSVCSTCSFAPPSPLPLRALALLSLSLALHAARARLSASSFLFLRLLCHLLHSSPSTFRSRPVCIRRVLACCAHLFVAPCPRRGARPSALPPLPRPLLSLRRVLLLFSLVFPSLTCALHHRLLPPLLLLLCALHTPRPRSSRAPFPRPLLPLFAFLFPSSPPRSPLLLAPSATSASACPLPSHCPCLRPLLPALPPVDAAPRPALPRLPLPVVCPPLLPSPLPLPRSLLACALSFFRLLPALAPSSLLALHVRSSSVSPSPRFLLRCLSTDCDRPSPALARTIACAPSSPALCPRSALQRRSRLLLPPSLCWIPTISAISTLALPRSPSFPSRSLAALTPTLPGAARVAC